MTYGIQRGEVGDRGRAMQLRECMWKWTNKASAEELRREREKQKANRKISGTERHFHMATAQKSLTLRC